MENLSHITTLLLKPHFSFFLNFFFPYSVVSQAQHCIETALSPASKFGISLLIVVFKLSFIAGQVWSERKLWRRYKVHLESIYQPHKHSSASHFYPNVPKSYPCRSKTIREGLSNEGLRPCQEHVCSILRNLLKTK